MKKRSRQETNQTAPLTSPESKPPEAIPPEFKQFEGKTQIEALKLAFGPFLAQEQAGPVFAGLVSGLFDTGVPVPEWTKRASLKFLELSGFDFLKALHKDMPDPLLLECLGKVIGLNEKTPNKLAHPDSIAGKFEKEFLNPLTNFTRDFASKADPESAAAFFNARNEAGKLHDKTQNLSQRAKIYAVIASCWQQVQKFKSTAELHEWLLSHKQPDGNSVFAPQTDSREIRKICQSIGLKFQNSWRKADKINPGHGP